MGCASSSDDSDTPRGATSCAFCRKHHPDEPLITLECGHQLHPACQATLRRASRGCPLWTCNDGPAVARAAHGQAGLSPAAAKYLEARLAAKKQEQFGEPTSCLKSEESNTTTTCIASQSPENTTPPVPRRLVATQGMLRRVAFAHMTPPHSPVSSRSASPRSAHGSFRSSHQSSRDPQSPVLHPALVAEQ